MNEKKPLPTRNCQCGGKIRYLGQCSKEKMLYCYILAVNAYKVC